MKLKTKFLSILVLLFMMSNVSAQKIGYANVKLLLNYMPENKTMKQTLNDFQQNLSKPIAVKQELGQTKVNEYQSIEKTPQNEARLKQLETEIAKLDQEIQNEKREAENKIAQKRQDLLAPITQKIQNAIDALSKAEGYDYILNSVDGSGLTIVLKGPEKDNLTENLATRLGIVFPKN